MRRLGYAKQSVMKVVRTKHQVTCSTSCRAEDLRKYLESVPPHARMVDVDIDGHYLVMEFDDERKDKDETN